MNPKINKRENLTDISFAGITHRNVHEAEKAVNLFNEVRNMHPWDIKVLVSMLDDIDS